MAVRFLVIFGYNLDRQRELTDSICQSTNLSIDLQTTTLLVFGPGDVDSIKVDNQHGIVIGHLFDRSTEPKRRLSLTRRETEEIRNTNGTTLFEQYWGGYVAILAGSHPDEIFTLRDPSGGMPCYYLKTSSGVVLSSDIETLSAAGFVSGEINWSLLNRHLLASDLRAPETPLKGITELMPGTRACFRSGEFSPIVEQVWTPWDYVNPLSSRDTDRQSAALHETITRCVGAWSSCFETILATISGGLDSSVVAACLNSSGADWLPMTMATDEYNGDERRYAKLLADSLKRPLIEGFHNSDDVDISRTSAPHLPRPIGNGFGQSQRKVKLEAAKRIGANAIFTGLGGDNIFCFMQSATPVVDRFFVEGITPKLFWTAVDIADMTGASLLDVAKMALQKAKSAQQPYNWKVNTRFLNRKNGDETIPLHHPWLNAPHGAFPGKVVHVALLIRIQATLESYSRFCFGPTISPLLSQPLVELCLSIPSWTWCSGGINRSPVREAFLHDLPSPILKRVSKGGPDAFCIDIIESNARKLKELLLDGLLRENGILDARAVDMALSGTRPLEPPDHVRLSALAEAECWARHWQACARNHGPSCAKVNVIMDCPAN